MGNRLSSSSSKSSNCNGKKSKEKKVTSRGHVQTVPVKEPHSCDHGTAGTQSEASHGLSNPPPHSHSEAGTRSKLSQAVPILSSHSHYKAETQSKPSQALPIPCPHTRDRPHDSGVREAEASATALSCSFPGLKPRLDLNSRNASRVSKPTTHPSNKPKHHSATFQLCLAHEHRITESELEFTHNEIGRGSFGVVSIVKYKDRKCAMKQLHLLLHENGALETFLRECEISSKLKHPNIVEFIGVCVQQDTYAILVTELMEQSLYQLLSNPQKPLDLQSKLSIARDVVQGLKYLHDQCKLIHRDVSSTNVFIALDMTAKLGDLGMVKHHLQKNKTQCPGHQAYMPPEALSHEDCDYSFPLDIFSFGALFMEILTGEYPSPETFQHCKSELTRRKRDIYKLMVALAQHSELLRERIMQLVYKCLDNNPGSRPTASEAGVEIDEIISLAESEVSTPMLLLPGRDLPRIEYVDPPQLESHHEEEEEEREEEEEEEERKEVEEEEERKEVEEEEERKEEEEEENPLFPSIPEIDTNAKTGLCHQGLQPQRVQDKATCLEHTHSTMNNYEESVTSILFEPTTMHSPPTDSMEPTSGPSDTRLVKLVSCKQPTTFHSGQYTTRLNLPQKPGTPDHGPNSTVIPKVARDAVDPGLFWDLLSARDILPSDKEVQDDLQVSIPQKYIRRSVTQPSNSPIDRSPPQLSNIFHLVSMYILLKLKYLCSQTDLGDDLAKVKNGLTPKDLLTNGEVSQLVSQCALGKPDSRHKPAPSSACIESNPTLPGSSPASSPTLASPSSSASSPTLPGSSPASNPTLPGSSPASNPTLPGSSPASNPTLPGSSPASNPTLPGSSPASNHTLADPSSLESNPTLAGLPSPVCAESFSTSEDGSSYVHVGSFDDTVAGSGFLCLHSQLCKNTGKEQGDNASASCNSSGLPVVPPEAEAAIVTITLVKQGTRYHRNKAKKWQQVELDVISLSSSSNEVSNPCSSANEVSTTPSSPTLMNEAERCTSDMSNSTDSPNKEVLIQEALHTDSLCSPALHCEANSPPPVVARRRNSTDASNMSLSCSLSTTRTFCLKSRGSNEAIILYIQQSPLYAICLSQNAKANLCVVNIGHHSEVVVTQQSKLDETLLLSSQIEVSIFNNSANEASTTPPFISEVKHCIRDMSNSTDSTLPPNKETLIPEVLQTDSLCPPALQCEPINSPPPVVARRRNRANASDMSLSCFLSTCRAFYLRYVRQSPLYTTCLSLSIKENQCVVNFSHHCKLAVAQQSKATARKCIDRQAPIPVTNLYKFLWCLLEWLLLPGKQQPSLAIALQELPTSHHDAILRSQYNFQTTGGCRAVEYHWHSKGEFLLVLMNMVEQLWSLWDSTLCSFQYSHGGNCSTLVSDSESANELDSHPLSHRLAFSYRKQLMPSSCRSSEVNEHPNVHPSSNYTQSVTSVTTEKPQHKHGTTTSVCSSCKPLMDTVPKLAIPATSNESRPMKSPQIPSTALPPAQRSLQVLPHGRVPRTCCNGKGQGSKTKGDQKSSGSSNGSSSSGTRSAASSHTSSSESSMSSGGGGGGSDDDNKRRRRIKSQCEGDDPDDSEEGAEGEGHEIPAGASDGERGSVKKKGGISHNPCGRKKVGRKRGKRRTSHKKQSSTLHAQSPSAVLPPVQRPIQSSSARACYNSKGQCSRGKKSNQESCSGTCSCSTGSASSHMTSEESSLSSGGRRGRGSEDGNRRRRRRRLKSQYDPDDSEEREEISEEDNGKRRCSKTKKPDQCGSNNNSGSAGSASSHTSSKQPLINSAGGSDDGNEQRRRLENKCEGDVPDSREEGEERDHEIPTRTSNSGKGSVKKKAKIFHNPCDSRKEKIRRRRGQSHENHYNTCHVQSPSATLPAVERPLQALSPRTCNNSKGQCSKTKESGQQSGSSGSSSNGATAASQTAEKFPASSGGGGGGSDDGNDRGRKKLKSQCEDDPDGGEEGEERSNEDHRSESSSVVSENIPDGSELKISSRRRSHTRSESDGDTCLNNSTSYFKENKSHFDQYSASSISPPPPCVAVTSHLASAHPEHISWSVSYIQSESESELEWDCDTPVECAFSPEQCLEEDTFEYCEYVHGFIINRRKTVNLDAEYGVSESSASEQHTLPDAKNTFSCELGGSCISPSLVDTKDNPFNIVTSSTNSSSQESYMEHTALHEQSAISQIACDPPVLQYALSLSPPPLPLVLPEATVAMCSEGSTNSASQLVISNPTSISASLSQSRKNAVPNDSLNSALPVPVSRCELVTTTALSLNCSPIRQDTQIQQNALVVAPTVTHSSSVLFLRVFLQVVMGTDSTEGVNHSSSHTELVCESHFSSPQQSLPAQHFPQAMVRVLLSNCLPLQVEQVPWQSICSGNSSEARRCVWMLSDFIAVCARTHNVRALLRILKTLQGCETLAVEQSKSLLSSVWVDISADTLFIIDCEGVVPSASSVQTLLFSLFTDSHSAGDCHVSSLCGLLINYYQTLPADLADQHKD